MRSNPSLSGSANRRADSKLGLSPLPVEWLDAGSWRLPSGKALAEFALQAGFLAPLLLKAERFGKKSPERLGTLRSSAAARSKHLGKGGGR